MTQTIVLPGANSLVNAVSFLKQQVHPDVTQCIDRWPFDWLPGSFCRHLLPGLSFYNLGIDRIKLRVDKTSRYI